nr:hypothetical protein [Ningiella sp. W23]
MLTISVAVEGVLNDIFIPAIVDDLKDQELEEEKKRISLLVDGLADISAEHIESIRKFIARWGNVHPKKCWTTLKVLR